MGKCYVNIRNSVMWCILAIFLFPQLHEQRMRHEWGTHPVTDHIFCHQSTVSVVQNQKLVTLRSETFYVNWMIVRPSVLPSRDLALPLTMTMQSLWPWHHRVLWIINRGAGHHCPWFVFRQTRCYFPCLDGKS